MRTDGSESAVQVETTVIRALERKPEIAVPADFAARVAQSLPARKMPSDFRVRPMFGRVAAYLAVAVTTVVLMILARTHPEAVENGRGFLFAIEVLLVAQLLAVGLWLGMRSDGV